MHPVLLPPGMGWSLGSRKTPQAAESIATVQSCGAERLVWTLMDPMGLAPTLHYNSSQNGGVDVLDSLLQLARALAAPDADMAILAEGNVSARADDDSFWVKGSGQAMGAMGADGFSRVSLDPVLAAIGPAAADRSGRDAQRQSPSTPDPGPGAQAAVRDILNSACLSGPPPSTEAFMHGLLLSVKGTNFVGHVHPTQLLSLLCLAQARGWADKRLFPDDIVCCGPAACFVPYVAPGLELARTIQREAADFHRRFGIAPKTYWLENHGLIAVGANSKEVETACLMSVKSARTLLGALQTGCEIKWLTDDEVSHIFNWPDEHARQRALWGADGLTG